MADLGQPQNTIAILKKYDFTFQKKFGQNFLIDTHVLEKIVDAADIGKDDLVLEIGPGIGTVTQYLCEAARQVIAVEIDRKLIKILRDTLSNLPYYITTPIIMTLLEKRVPVTDMTLMMQEEVARRMQAVPGNKDYGALSLAVQYYSVPYIAAFVPQNCFMPRPNVGSAVVNLKCHEKPPVEVKDEELMFKLIKASFAQRRKTLQNGLTNSVELDFTKEKITEAILKMQEILGMKQNPLIRGETLTLKEFACLSDILS